MFQPGKEFFVKAEAAVYVLRGVDMQVDEGRNDDILVVIDDCFRACRFRQVRHEARYDAVFDMGILIFTDRQFMA